MSDREQLYTALRNADKAGDTAAAKRLAEYIRAMPAEGVAAPDATPSLVDQIPGGGAAGNRNAGKPEANSDSFLQRVAGLAEPVLTLASGAVAAPVASLAALGKTIKDGKYGQQDVAAEDLGGRVMNAMTYQPRTQTGANLTQLVGNVAERSGVAGLALPELNAAASTAGAARNAVGSAARTVGKAVAASPVDQGAVDAAIASSGGPVLSDLVRMPAKQLDGVGAARAAEATQRAARAQSLPVPINLTKGQLTRDRTQVAFERETAKQKEGAPLASHYEDQNATFGQNLDAAVDQTGAQNMTPRAVGKSVVAALDAKDKAKQTEIRGLYQQARDAGEMQGQVDVSALSDWVAKNKGKDKLAPIVTAIENELKQNAKTVGGGADPLTLAQRPKQTVMPLEASEDLRQAINKLAEPGTPNVVYGKEAKALIDAAQEGKGGDLFKQARRAYENYSNEFTNRDVIDKALRTKPGTKDRAVAYEDIFNHSILNGSTDDVRHVFRVLEAHPAGSDPAVVEAGQQAARDLRGAVINHIKDEMQKNLNMDSTGARTGSPAKIDAIVRELDKDGKLDVIFGKKGAEQVRDLRDTAIDIYTSPTGTVNSSNTASALMRKLDDIAGYAKGTPIIGKAVNYSAQAIKSANTRRKVREALNPNLKDLAGKGSN